MKPKKDNTKKAKAFAMPDKFDRWLGKKPNPVKPPRGMAMIMKMLRRE